MVTRQAAVTAGQARTENLDFPQSAERLSREPHQREDDSTIHALHALTQ